MSGVEPIDLSTASEADLRGVHQVATAVERAAGVPEELIAPFELALAECRHPLPTRHRRSFVVRDAGRIVAVGGCVWEDAQSNRDHVGVDVDVLPSHQRRSLGRAVLTAAVQTACDEFSPRLLDLEARPDDPAVTAFLDRFGFGVRMRTPRNVLWTRDLDRALLEAWVERAPERAADYRLVAWDGPCPDERLELFLDVWHVMNTAPLEDLDWEDEVLTADRLRAWDAHDAKRGVTPWVVAAEHVPTRELAGFTVLLFSRHWPEAAFQGDTGVRVDHRRRGLGRWLKAVNALRLLEEHPEVQLVTTWNAGSNEPMLNINHAMGFARLEWWGEWQAEAKRARDALETR